MAVPFEYAARFALKGVAGTQLESAINTSVDGVFVATAIGYGFEPGRSSSTVAIAPTSKGREKDNFLPWTVTLGQVPPSALINGVRFSAEGRNVAFEEDGGGLNLVRSATESISPRYRRTLLERVDVDTDVSFLFSMLDTATGRELQDEPIHNLAGLGKSNGERPFRRLAHPMVFQPRSTIRMQVVELGGGRSGELDVVLFGYKIVDLGLCSEDVVRAYADLSSHPRQESGGAVSGRLIPFDYVAAAQLTGEPGNRIIVEVPINVDGGFVATSIGYGLQTDPAPIQVRVGSPAAKVALGSIPLSAFADRDLLDGVRIRPNLVRFAFANDGTLQSVPTDLVPQLFERVLGSGQVSFRYSLFDSGIGREFQNQPVLSLAGLGIADGDRPFKVLSRPLVIAQRSSLRVEIVELRGRGRLQIVFQGYKRIRARSA